MQTRSLVRTEGIITQLIFEHALRIRVKAETPEEEKIPESPTTPDNLSVANEEGSEGDSQDDTIRASTASVTSSTTKPAKESEPAKSSSKSANLVGKACTTLATRWICQC